MTDGARRRLLQHVLGTIAFGAGRPSSAAAPEPAELLLTQAHSVLEERRTPELSLFLREWPSSSERRHVDASTVPVVRWLAPIKQAAPAFSAPLVSALVEAAPVLSWRRSYTAVTAGADFYENYGWTELAGLAGPVPSVHLACGLLLLGPQVTYPPHRHEADEIYVPLVGTARWKRGHAGWRDEKPGSVIHHSRHESHAMNTGMEPLLALYLWRSHNLAQSSRLDHPLPSPEKSQEGANTVNHPRRTPIRSGL